MIAAVLLARNAEDVLPRALDSVKDHVDKIIAVMAGESTDGTFEVLQRYGAFVMVIPWEDNFAQARNALFSLAHAQGATWVLLIDADDRLEHGELLRSAVSQLEKQSAGGAHMQIASNSFSYLQKRIFNLQVPGKWIGRVHETYAGTGTYYEVEGLRIVHSRGKAGFGSRDRNLAIFEKWMKEEPEAFDGHVLYNYASELRYHGRFEDAARVYVLAIAKVGWSDEKCLAYLHRADCYMALKAWLPAWGSIVEAMKLKPNWRDPYISASRWFYLQKMWMMFVVYDEFSRSLKEANTMLPVIRANYTSVQACYLSYALARLGRVEEALAAAREGLRYDQTCAMLLQNEKAYQAWLEKGNGNGTKEDTSIDTALGGDGS